MDADYLDRLGYDGPVVANRECLARLHDRHLQKIPFENLDIYYKKSIYLDIDALKTKVIKNKRGGFCYELNGFFFAY